MVAIISFTCPSATYFCRKNAKLTRNTFLLLSIVRNENNIGYESVVGCWIVCWGFWLDIEYLSLMWLSDKRAAVTTSHNLYGFRKTSQACCSSKNSFVDICLDCASAFHRIWKSNPFSVDLPDFWRSFRVKSNTTIKIYILNDNLPINEMHNIIEENSLFEILTTNW